MIWGAPPPVTDPALHQILVQQDSGLSDAEIQRIRAIGDALETTRVKLYGRFTEDRVKATGSHLVLNDDTRWLYERMATVAERINGQHFRYDLSGFLENFYYLSYRAGDHFGWHVDIGDQTPAPRKLSLVLQLSDPSEYDGGDFEALIAVDAERADKRKGLVCAFPSYRIHRVTPITRGVRRTLAMFTCGPEFR